MTAALGSRVDVFFLRAYTTVLEGLRSTELGISIAVTTVFTTATSEFEI